MLILISCSQETAVAEAMLEAQLTERECKLPIQSWMREAIASELAKVAGQATHTALDSLKSVRHAVHLLCVVCCVLCVVCCLLSLSLSRSLAHDVPRSCGMIVMQCLWQSTISWSLLR
jgi:hypothetical protein